MTSSPKTNSSLDKELFRRLSVSLVFSWRLRQQYRSRSKTEEAKKLILVELGKVGGKKPSNCDFGRCQESLKMLEELDNDFGEHETKESVIEELKRGIEGLKTKLWEKKRLQEAVEEEIKDLKHELKDLRRENDSISEKIGKTSGRRHKKRSKKSKRSEKDQEKRVCTSEIQTKDASQSLPDAIDNDQAATSNSCGEQQKLVKRDFSKTSEAKEMNKGPTATEQRIEPRASLMRTSEGSDAPEKARDVTSNVLENREDERSIQSSVPQCHSFLDCHASDHYQINIVYADL
ncbi:hypothetical protein CAEBREN_18335 [Caenorhabditis brenneri]|uniref:Uncharacterized protein n=1 Tax=Caenorhabditis brenneri TaxID=135651 RepID=G0NP68_CAEBE|nr:hypothetical protein CAEBREN_18335 [Caenorhabditis brenneri]